MLEDPYSDPATGVLYNKLGLVTAADFEAAEREIRKRIFGDIYEWAGQIRTVAIAKGAVFCLPQYIDSSAAIIFRELHDEECLRGLRDAGFMLAWQHLDPVRNVEAAAAIMRGDQGPMSEMLDALVRDDT
jgi:cell filamentation protein, protein adenylyltransferase